MPRYLVTAFAVLNMIDTPRTYGLFSGESVDGLALAGSVLGYLAMALSPWAARIAASIGVIALTSVLVRGAGIGVEPFVVVPCLIALAARTSRWPLWVATGIYTAWAIGLAIVMDNQDVGWLYGVMIVFSVLAGLALRHLLLDRLDARREVEELNTANQRIRREERELLARELHDIVAHQLTNISLQVMTSGTSTDPVVLRDTLTKIDRASQTGASELRALVGVLRETTDEGEPVNSSGTLLAADLAALRIVDTANHIAATLTGHGYSPQIRIGPEAATLSGTLQTTTARIVQEASTNILRYSPPGSACTFSVTVDPDTVSVRVSSPLPPTPLGGLAWQSTGTGLRGLRERVSLTGGTYQVGPVNESWVLEAVLPHHRPD